MLYTLLQIREGGSGRPPLPPPPHRSFENQWRNIDILYIILKGIVWRFRFSFNFSKIFLFRNFMSKFSRSDSSMAPEWVFEKISNFWNMNILYIVLKHVIWRFWICNYFPEISKFRDFMNTLRNFAKFVFAPIFAKFKYLSKKFILTESPDHVL